MYAGAKEPRVPLAEGDTIVKVLRQRGQLVECMLALHARMARFLEAALK